MTERTAAIAAQNAPAHLIDHNLVPHAAAPGVRYELRPVRAASGSSVEGLYNAWITLDNPAQY
ncbi:MAG: 6-oxocyclohex-1-ene-1-carbonyl-CoA hydratase, partial [Gammaproteobacteria bacterium]|nr:6-oxocyclohex-1-ene-1-carbonyl-CoA hydratase [Gammaproteobacteria bacterium]